VQEKPLRLIMWLLPPPSASKIVSLEESVGKNWFREDAEVVIECSFIGFLGAETV